MPSTKKHTTNTPSYNHPLLSDQQQPQYVVVLPPYPPPHHRHLLFRKSCQRCLTSFAILLLFFIAASFILWPSDPHLSVVRLRLDHLKFHRSPKFSLDVALDLTVRILNVDLYSIDYDSLNVAIGYRGEKLGFVTSNGGFVKPRGNSYVNATLQLDGVEVLSDLVLLIEDLAKGEVLLDTETEMSGRIGLYLFDLPLKESANFPLMPLQALIDTKYPGQTKISCAVIVNTRNQTISRQSCYPEVAELS